MSPQKTGKILLKFIKYLSITIISLLALLFVLPYLFPKTVSEQIKRWANQSITSELEFSSARLTFFSHFPTLTLSLKNVSLTGSSPYPNDTLLAAREIGLGIDLSSIFKEQIRINKIYVSDGSINVLVNEAGQPNYNIYQTSDNNSNSNSNDSSSAQLKLERIEISNTSLTYADSSIPFTLRVKEVDYIGKGDLSASIFDLSSKINMRGTTLEYDHEPYLEDKDLNAKLLTQINTNSLALHFNRNDLSINKLPLNFIGKFEFLSNGYFLDFSLNTPETNFSNLFTALPPAFVKWVEKRSVGGKLKMQATLKGAYINEEAKAPTLSFDMNVNNGSLSTKGVTTPAKNFLFDFHVKLPSLNMDSLTVDMDTLNFSVADKYIQGAIHTVGFNTPSVSGHIKGLVDLEKINQLFLQPEIMAMKGLYQFDFNTNGQFARGQNPHSIRPDTIITSFPNFSFNSSLKNGFLKYTSLPIAIETATFAATASCTDGIFNNIKAQINQLNAKALGNYLDGHIHLNGLHNFPIDANIKTHLNLEDIAKIIPIKDYQFKGLLNAELQCAGSYNQQQGIFPVAQLAIKVNNGEVQTPYYPAPIKDIAVDAGLISTNGNANDITIFLKPVAFTFEGEPFFIQSDIKNLNNIEYTIVSKGTLNLDKIYKAFAVTGYNVTGVIKTDINLKGNEKDALAGNLNRLQNNGTIMLDNVKLYTPLYPLPLQINKGNLHFKNDQLVADALHLQYGKTNANMSGYFKNMIAYSLKSNEPLYGQLQLNSPYLNVAEWMAFAPSSEQNTDTLNNSNNGVILLPKDLFFQFNAKIKEIDYEGLLLKDFQSEIALNKGELLLKETNFTIIDAPVKMEGSYQSTHPSKAAFTYTITADSFDIEKAYNNIAMFREMVTSAKGIKGIVGLHYTIAGHLDENMSPIYPSLKGGGELTLKNIRIKGFKLLQEVGKATQKEDIAKASGELKGITIKTTLADNILTITRTKLRFVGFRPRFEGQIGLDGKLNLKGRLGLPPFGIFGIPFSVSGNSENPKVRLKRGQPQDELTPDEYDDDVVLPEEPPQP